MRPLATIRPLSAAVLLLTVAAGCAPREPSSDRSSRPTGFPASDETRPSSDAPGGAVPVCLDGGPFVADGPLPLGATGSGEVTGIRALRWKRHEGCERFVVDLEGGGPGDAPRVSLLRELGVVRITVPGVRDVGREATDADLEGPLVRAAYAVWAPDGESTFVDLHLGAAAEARATLLADPARVVVDLRPGGGPLPAPAAADRRVVVLEPRPGEASYPLRVVGYARTFEANVVARMEREGEEVAETFTTATSWLEAWGHFELTLEEGPVGPVALKVGEYSARDGTWEGVTVELVMRQAGSPPAATPDGG